MCGCAAVLGGGLPTSWQPHGDPPLCPPTAPDASALPPGASPPWGGCLAQSLALTVGNPSGVPPSRRPTLLVPASRLARWARLQSPAPSSRLPPTRSSGWKLVGLCRACWGRSCPDLQAGGSGSVTSPALRPLAPGAWRKAAVWLTPLEGSLGSQARAHRAPWAAKRGEGRRWGVPLPMARPLADCEQSRECGSRQNGQGREGGAGVREVPRGQRSPQPGRGAASLGVSSAQRRGVCTPCWGVHLGDSTRGWHCVRVWPQLWVSWWLRVKSPPAVPEPQAHAWVGISPGGGHGSHSSVLAWRSPWTGDPDGLQSTRSQSPTDLATETTPE